MIATMQNLFTAILLTSQCLTINSFTILPGKDSSGWGSTSKLMMASTVTTSKSTAIDYDVVKVDLENNRNYPIYIGDSFDDKQAGEMLRKHVKGKDVLLITNDLISPLHLEKYVSILENSNENDVEERKGITVHTLVLPDGEEQKNIEVLQLILNKALEEALDRKCTFIALGGGVIGDMVGFASAIYQRGVNFIQIPTSVMAMVDSSVGGKTGVNHPLGKNMVGAFHQPQCVFIDIHNLSTLPDRELYSGISEIIKYGLIRDGPFFLWQEQNMNKLVQRDSDAFKYAIKRSCENKASVVKDDEKEAGLRATLNLGHTFGHAIENGSGYGTLLHGEAVSIGIAMASTMSLKLNWIDQTLHDRTIKILIDAKLPISLSKDSPMNRELFLKLMSVDKKVSNGKLFLVLLKGDLGGCLITDQFEQQALVETVDQYVAEI